MSEEKNIPNQQKEDGPDSYRDLKPEMADEKTSQHFPEDSHAPKSEISNQQQEAKNMEPHTHRLHNAPGKKFWHYFYEFLMLFLAVFCGFLAEYQLEHMIEHRREKQFMTTLQEDLKRDTAQLSRLKDYFTIIAARKDSLVRYLKPPVQNDKIMEYYRETAIITSIIGYAYNDRTIEQFRQSGNYRLIRKREIADSLTRYDNKMRNTFAKNYDVIWENRQKLYNDLNAIVDNISFEYFEGTGAVAEDSLRQKKLLPLQLVTNDNKLLMNFYNSALLQRGYMFDFIFWIDKMKLSAENLISLIQKEYHLQ